jgi:hypothetical protein
MKKLFSFIMGVSLCLNFMSLYGQDTQNIVKNLDKSKALLEDGAYKEAYKSLHIIYKQVGQIYIRHLEEQLLPNKINGFEKAYYSDYASEIEGNEITIIKTYMPSGTKEGQEYLKKVIISITNKNKLYDKISEVHLNEELSDFEPGKEYRATFVGKYRALFTLDTSSNYMGLSIIVGAAIIQIDAEGIDNTQDMYDIANSLNFENIYTHFGY